MGTLLSFEQRTYYNKYKTLSEATYEIQYWFCGGYYAAHGFRSESPEHAAPAVGDLIVWGYFVSHGSENLKQHHIRASSLALISINN